MRSGKFGFLGSFSAGGSSGGTDFNSYVDSLLPLMRWKLEQASGVTEPDASGNGYNGTLSGTTFAAEGISVPAVVGYSGLSRGYKFPDTGQVIASQSSYALALGASTSSEWTICIFLAGSPGSNQYLLNRGNSAALIYQYVTDTVEFFRTRGSGVNPRDSSGIPLGGDDTDTPHMIVYRYNNGQWSGFKDGAVVFDVSAVFSLSGSPSQWFLAESSGGSAHSPAKMWEVQLYDRALSNAEIADMWSYRDV